MRTERVLIAAGALLVTAVTVVLAVYGFSGGAPPFGDSNRDPAASGRGAWLLNPYCRNAPPPDFNRTPNVARTGQFEDLPYGYSVTIPAGTTAYTSGGDPPTGFAIVLSMDPRVYLRAEASYDVFYDITRSAVHRRDALAVRLHDKLLEDHEQGDALDGEAAGRYRMQFQCPGDSQTYLREDVIVIRNREIYRLVLQTVPARYTDDLQVLTAMQRSWRWRAIPKATR